ncbi:MAG: hypothetical protein AMJ69_09910 [Gammaproteobacteria bacterium SG8_47]|nr:MAG: hypothetical protein AMJ69_09910 [Gammaproteobacteria bacterium SG8_47]
MTTLRIRLELSPAQCLAYYRGVKQAVVARAEDGRTVRFPASELRRFVTPAGVHGSFELRYDDNNKLVSLRRLA